MICLDSNIVIAALKDDQSPAMSRIAQTLRERRSLVMSTIVLFELSFGVAKSVQKERNARRLAEFIGSAIELLQFDADDAAEAADIRAFLKRKGTPIGPYDILIAAQARRRNALLATANVGEFNRVPGLRTENWARP